MLYSLGLVLAFIATRLDSSHSRSVPSMQPKADTPQKAEKLTSWFPFDYAVLAFVVGFVAFVPTTYLPFVIRQSGFSSPTVISLVLTIDAAIGSVVAMLFGYLNAISRRLPHSSQALPLPAPGC